MARDHTKAGGETIAAPFTVMAEFQRNAGDGFGFAFETYISTADFDGDGTPISRLTYRDDPAQGFGAANQALWATVRQLVLNEMGLGGRNFAFTEFQWFPLNKVLTCSAVKGENNSVFTKRGADYDVFLAANAQVFTDLNTAAWTFAKTKDAFLASMS